MSEVPNVFDMLNSEAEFARLVGEIHKSALAVQNSVQNSRKSADMLDKKSEELSAQIERVEGLLMDLKTERKMLMEDINKHEAVLEEMQRLEESFNGAIQAYGNISNVYKIFDERLRAIEDSKGQNLKKEDIVIEPSQKEERDPRIDYDEVTSVEKLFNKYNGKIDGPVIVVRTKNFPWSGDYCMAIKNVSKGKAWGVRYSYGQPGKKTPLKADDEEYSMYCGPSLKTIAEDFKKR
ncbi:MAG: hypothetical protein IJ719_18940 [Clostridia bacterium]|nr:hypothetical protein [Clostridia bacterium]